MNICMIISGCRFVLQGLRIAKKCCLMMMALIFLNGKNYYKPGDEMNMNNFIAIIQKKNLRNSVFIDVTANDDVAKSYPHFYKKAYRL
ncbi:MAG: hypothetical protein WKF59_24280 [Chitinophagaceae bacterium]